MYTCKVAQKTCVARHVCDLFLVPYGDVAFIFLIFLSMTFVLTQYLPEPYSSTLDGFKIFETNLAELSSENVNTVSF